MCMRMCVYVHTLFLSFSLAYTHTHTLFHTHTHTHTQVINKYSTFLYRAPEMLNLYSKQLVNEKVDVWALGCIFYTLGMHG
jgi:serine/threonine protein kinase